MKLTLFSFLALLLTAFHAAASQATPSPVPWEFASDRYSVAVNGKIAPVFFAAMNLHFVSFDFTGQAEVQVTPNNNCDTYAVTLYDIRQMLISSHSDNREGKSSGYRSPLNVALSPDGKFRKAALVLEREPTRGFSYPAVIQTRDGLVHISYTYRRQNIRHVVLDPARLTLTPIVEGELPQ
jgi:hypothetical protein